MDACPECSCTLAVGQRYCLVCGARAGAPLPVALGLTRSLTPPGPPAAVLPPASPAPAGFADSLPSPPAAAAAILLMLGFGVFAAPHALPVQAAEPGLLVAVRQPAPVTATADEPAASPDDGGGGGGGGGGSSSPAAAAPLAPAPVYVPPPAPAPVAQTPVEPLPEEPAVGEEPVAEAPQTIAVVRLALPEADLPSVAAYRFRGVWLPDWAVVGEDGLVDELALLTGEEHCVPPAGAAAGRAVAEDADPALAAAIEPVPPADPLATPEPEPAPTPVPTAPAPAAPAPAAPAPAAAPGCVLPEDTPTLPAQLEELGRTFRAYVEDDADTATAGDPFPALPALAGSPDVLPLAELDAPTAEREPANVTLVLPGAAKADPAVADAWLVDTLAGLEAELVVVELADGALLLGPQVAGGTEVEGPFDSFSVLRTIEDLLGLPTLGAAADAEPLPWSQEVHGDDTGS